MIYSVQYLRGIAAMMVLWIHATGNLSQLGLPELPNEFGSAGVDLFFVISGFIMVVTIRKSPSASLFLLRRLNRIVPLYWAVTAAVVVVSLVAPSLLRSTVFDLRHTLASFAFLPWPNPAYPGLFPVVIPGWTLNYEMGFYVLLTLGLLVAPRHPFVFAGAILLSLSVLGLVGDFGQTAAGFYTDLIILEFALGMVAGWLYGASLTRAQQGLLAAGCIALVAVAVIYWDRNRFFSGGIPAFFAVLVLSTLERRHAIPKVDVLKTIGDASYSIYLTHPILVAAIIAGARAAGVPAGAGPAIALLCLTFVVTTLFGIAVYRAFEAPVTRSLNRLWTPLPSEAR